VDDRLSFGFFEVHRQTSLVAAERSEKSSREATEAPRVIATRHRLDFDDVCAKLGKQQAGSRPHHCVTEFQDPEARKRRCRHQPAFRSADGTHAILARLGRWRLKMRSAVAVVNIDLESLQLI
jgi:hypothetical protein